jgi:hypothetical protein
MTYESTGQRSSRLLGICVLIYCAWQSADLLKTWRSNSPEAWGWVMFAIWIAPAICHAVRSEMPAKPRLRVTAVVAALTLTGQMTELNVLQHAALVLAITKLRERLPGQWLMLISGFLWMPTCGWLLERAFAGWETSFRIAALSLVSAGLIWLQVGSRRGD